MIPVQAKAKAKDHTIETIKAITGGNYAHVPKRSKNQKSSIRKSKNTTAFILDQQGYFHNNKVFHITGAPMILSCLASILNSRLIFWYLNNNIALAKGNTMELREIYMQELPIPLPEQVEQKPFGDLAQTLIQNHEQIQQIRTNLVSLLKDEYTITNLPTKLKDWDKLTFQSFIAKLAS